MHDAVVKSPLSRRSVIIYGLAGAAVGVGALAAGCSPSAGPTGSPGASGSQRVALPTHVPFDSAPADRKGANGSTDLYAHYPSAPPATVPAPPGDGQPISVMLSIWYPAWPKAPENTALAQLNEQLGSDLEFQQVPGSEYAARFATMVAGNDLPALMQVANVPRLPEMMKAKYIDLTEHLSGDAVKKYPNLANIPTETWRATVANNGIYGIPTDRGMWQSPILFQRDELIRAKGMDPNDVTNFTDLLSFWQELTDAKNDQWALATLPTSHIRQMLRVPNGWRLDGDTLINAYEVPEQEEALNACLKIISSGVLRRDWATLSSDQVRLLFLSGKVLMCNGTYQAWTRYHAQYAEEGSLDLDGMPLAGYDGGQGGFHRFAPAYSVTGISKGNEDRVETLLGVLNHIAAPFGSMEYLSVIYGREGIDWTRDGTDPIQTEEGKKHAMLLTTLVNAPQVAYYPNHPPAAEKCYEHMLAMAPQSVEDPTRYRYSETNSQKSATITREIESVFTDIVHGRKKISDWAGAVDRWRSKGGDQIREELAQSLADEG